jgi:colicin import membrane protein
VSYSLRHLSWVFSIALHLAVLIGGAYVSTGPNIKLNLNKRMYEVNLVGPPHKGKPGAKSAPRQAVTAQSAPQKAVPKEAPAAKAPEEPKKPEKKAVPSETAKALPTANATVAEVKPEEPKKEEPKKEEPKKEAPKKEEPKKDEGKEAKKDDPKKDAKAEKGKKAPTKEEILAQALGDASKTAKETKAGSEGAAKGSAKGGSKDALADALADLGREVSGRGTSGDGTAEDGEGEGESSGSLEDYYASQVIKVIRQNWRFPRLSNVVLATTVELRVNQGGEIIGSRMVNGSGRSDFDASVMRAIEDTKQLPKLPETLPTTFMITFYNTENG